MATSEHRNVERWAIILAGGDGIRLRSLTRKISGRDLPKQFCRVVGNETLLEQTRRRVALSIDRVNSVVVVTRAHERFYAPLLADLPARRLVVQPQNRGTAPAVLYSLLRLARLAPEAEVALFPSDHYVENGPEFMRHVEVAFDALKGFPELTVLLGIAPQSIGTSYGWIEPAQPLSLGSSPLYRVGRFLEKPELEMARALMQRGCLWNSFVMVARLSTLLGLMMTSLPRLYWMFNRVRPTFGTIFEERAVRGLYDALDSVNFSEQVLASNAFNLAVLPVRGVAWTDLGEPRRVMDVLARTGAHPGWAVA